jgi:hypothetical protein
MLTWDLTASDTWGPVLREGVDKKELTVVPYELQLDYDYWTYRMEEAPVFGFGTA